MPKKLPPGLAAHLRGIVDDVAQDLMIRLEAGLRLYGMKTEDAARELLEDLGQPMTRDELVEQLKKGGIAAQIAESGAHGGATGNIKRSISFQTEHPKGQEGKKLRAMGQLIGLYEWPDGKFEAGRKGKSV